MAKQVRKESDKRESKRIDLISKIYCKKYFEGGQAKEFENAMEFTLLNVSIGGLGITTEVPFENGSVLILDIQLGDERFKNLSARVIWSIKKGNIYRYGLEIINLSGKLFSYLRKLDNSITAQV